MKKKGSVIAISFAILLTAAVIAGSQTVSNAVVQSILSSYSHKRFAANAVPDDQLNLILQCGVKAPSARNSQLWKFTVVNRMDTMKAIIASAGEGNTLIVVSGAVNAPQGIDVDFDCALAVQNMYIAAQALGLAAHIYTMPIKHINTAMKETLGIPADYRAVAVLQIGTKATGVDAGTAASSRKPIADVVITGK